MDDGADRVAIEGRGEQSAFSRIGLAGSSEPSRRSMEAIARLALVDVPVLLQGETGTGKELAARAMHALSARRTRPFVPVDCGALPETLFAGELSGHVRGAFTDARHDAAGLVAQAEVACCFSTRSRCVDADRKFTHPAD
jgi:two-component system response regulator GlrR